MCGHPVGRPAVEHRILHLVRNHLDTGPDDFLQALLVEIRQAKIPDLSSAAQLVKPRGRVHVTWHVVAPPVQLHEIEVVHPEARQRAVNAAQTSAREWVGS